MIWKGFVCGFQAAAFSRDSTLIREHRKVIFLSPFWAFFKKCLSSLRDAVCYLGVLMCVAGEARCRVWHRRSRDACQRFVWSATRLQIGGMLGKPSHPCPVIFLRFRPLPKKRQILNKQLFTAPRVPSCSWANDRATQPEKVLPRSTNWPSAKAQPGNESTGVWVASVALKRRALKYVNIKVLLLSTLWQMSVESRVNLSYLFTLSLSV